MKLLNKIDDLLAFLEKSLAVSLFALLVLTIFFNIIFRNIFQISFHTLLEIAPTLVVWLALLGATLGLRSHRHIKLELLLRFCSRKVRRMAGMAAGAFGTVIMGILFFASLEFVTNEVAIFGSRGWLSLIFPVFFSLACFRYMTTTVYHFKGFPTSEPNDVIDKKPSLDTRPSR